MEYEWLEYGWNLIKKLPMEYEPSTTNEVLMNGGFLWLRIQTNIAIWNCFSAQASMATWFLRPWVELRNTKAMADLGGTSPTFCPLVSVEMAYSAV